MQCSIVPEPISYQLLIVLDRPQRLTIGHLGAFDFPAGCYLYTGSARRGLQARIARHRRAAKRRHWHIDYLLMAEGACLVEVYSSPWAECTLNQASPGQPWVRGFGASDCWAGCASHLRYVQGGLRACHDWLAIVCAERSP